MDKNFRLIFSFKENARINMDTDKALALCFDKTSIPILRLYTWQNSFTVGLSQKCEEYPQLIEEYKNNCAKRITGGGVLFHGSDISYSLIIPNNYFGDLNVKQTYEKICQFLLVFYKNLGLNPSFAKDLEDITLSKSNFCQIGYEAYDIIINGKKIGGNAQKRSKNMIFQHGSIPIKQTKDKIKEGYCLEDVGVFISFQEAKDELIKAFKSCFNIEFIDSALEEKEINKLKKISKE